MKKEMASVLRKDQGLKLIRIMCVSHYINVDGKGKENFIWGKNKSRFFFGIRRYGRKNVITRILEKCVCVCVCVYVQPIQDDGLLCNS